MGASIAFRGAPSVVDRRLRMFPARRPRSATATQKVGQAHKGQRILRTVGGEIDA